MRPVATRPTATLATARRSGLAAATLCVALLSVPTIAHAETSPPDLGAQIAALRNHLEQVVAYQSGDPAPMAPSDLDALRSDLSTAAKAVTGKPCDAAAALQAYAD